MHQVWQQIDAYAVVVYTGSSQGQNVGWTRDYSADLGATPAGSRGELLMRGQEAKSSLKMKSFQFLMPDGNS